LDCFISESSPFRCEFYRVRKAFGRIQGVTAAGFGSVHLIGRTGSIPNGFEEFEALPRTYLLHGGPYAPHPNRSASTEIVDTPPVTNTSLGKPLPRSFDERDIAADLISCRRVHSRGYADYFLPGPGARIAETTSRSSPSFRIPCGTPEGAINITPGSIATSRSSSRNVPVPSST